MLKQPEGTDHSGSEDDRDAAEEWTGIEEVPPVDHEAEYIDEDKYTTVTVEALDLSKEGLQKVEREGRKQVEEDPAAETKENLAETGQKDTKSRKRIWTKDKPKDRSDKPKKKKKKFRYETKAERKFTRMKQGAKNSKEAKARREG
jgi:ribosomal RNA-processing protein 17